MKKHSMLSAILALAMVLSASAAFAAKVEGTIQAVDGTAMKLEVANAAGETSAVWYDAATSWPEGVTDPAGLIGKSVTITTDEASEKATSVEEAAAASESASAEAAAGSAAGEKSPW